MWPSCPSGSRSTCQLSDLCHDHSHASIFILWQQQALPHPEPETPAKFNSSVLGEGRRVNKGPGWGQGTLAPVILTGWPDLTAEPDWGACPGGSRGCYSPSIAVCGDRLVP